MSETEIAREAMREHAKALEEMAIGETDLSPDDLDEMESHARVLIGAVRVYRQHRYADRVDGDL